MAVSDPAEHRTRFYLRIQAKDRPTVLAKIAGVLGAFDVAVSELVQEERGGENDAPITVVLLTHEVPEAAMRGALRELSFLPQIVEPPHAIRIEPG